MKETSFTQEDFINAFILMMSGAADWYNEKEIKYNNDKEKWAITTIQFSTNSPTVVKVNYYYKFNDVLARTENYVDGLLEGDNIGWYSNGLLWWESVYRAGVRVKK